MATVTVPYTQEQISAMDKSEALALAYQLAAEANNPQVANIIMEYWAAGQYDIQRDEAAEAAEAAAAAAERANDPIRQVGLGAVGAATTGIAKEVGKSLWGELKGTDAWKGLFGPEKGVEAGANAGAGAEAGASVTDSMQFSSTNPTTGDATVDTGMSPEASSGGEGMFTGDGGGTTSVSDFGGGYGYTPMQTTSVDYGGGYGYTPINETTMSGVDTSTALTSEGAAASGAGEGMGLFGGVNSATGAYQPGALSYAGAAVGAYNLYNELSGDRPGRPASAGAASGAASGAAIGSVIPGVGTALGAIIGALIGGFHSMTGSGKGKDQLMRDQARDVLEEQGIFSRNDDGHIFTFDDGTTFNVGADMGTRLQNELGGEREAFEIDWGRDPNSPDAPGLYENPDSPVGRTFGQMQELMYGVMPGNKKLADNFAGYMTNAIMSAGGNLDDRVAEVTRKFGGGAAAEPGIEARLKSLQDAANEVKQPNPETGYGNEGLFGASTKDQPFNPVQDKGPITAPGPDQWQKEEDMPGVGQSFEDWRTKSQYQPQYRRF